MQFNIVFNVLFSKFVKGDFIEIVQNHVVECRGYWNCLLQFFIEIGVTENA